MSSPRQGCFFPTLTLKKASKNINITGRVGTNFQCAIDYYESHPEFQGMIIFTDGYAEVPKIRKAKQILWILTGKYGYDNAKNGLRVSNLIRRRGFQA